MEIAVDLVEGLADKLRSDAKRLAEDKSNLIRKIETLQDLLRSGENMTLSEAQRADDLLKLSKALELSETVQVSINLMSRDKAQQSANKEINRLLVELERDVRKSPMKSRIRVLSYLNACCSNQVGGVPPDEHFGVTIVGCTLDDQKEAKKLIKEMLDHVEQECSP